MEMNKYLIAALYVMAGCVVAVPLKVQGNSEPLRVERYRLILTSSVKIISSYVDDQEQEAVSWDGISDYRCMSGMIVAENPFSFVYPFNEKIGVACYTSHKIRAPGVN